MLKTTNLHDRTAKYHVKTTKTYFQTAENSLKKCLKYQN